jgi:Outer membrane protein beta-barrel domain
MVKYVSVLLLLMAFAAPAFAQDIPQVELAFGYGNINVKDLVDGRHSGFATHQTINLNSVFGIENYFGYYGMGTNPSVGKIEMLTNVFGARFAYRAAGPVLYGGAGIGGAWLRFPNIGAGSNSAMAFKVGGGVDIPIGDSFAWKVDVSRMSFHFSDAVSSWKSGVNISTGIVLKIQY